MKRALFALALGALLCLAEPSARACSCSGQGPASALTRSDQTWGMRASERLVLGQGQYDAQGNYRPLESPEHDRTVEYVLLAAYRVRRLELAASFAYGARLAQLSNEAGRTLGFGDSNLRLRYEATDQPEPWQPGIAPALAVLGTVRLPSARSTGIAPRGLGATEFALGVVLERSLTRAFRLALLAQVAGRLPDTSLGVSRRLGPRASAELTLSYFATADWVLSALLSVRWEGNVTVRQRQQDGTAQRLTEVGAALSWQPWSSPFRAGVAQHYAPALDVLGANTAQNATSELWLGYVR